MGSTTLNCALLVFIWLTISGGEARRAEYNGTVDWWQKTVIYQVYPRSFQDSDNDGVGDIKGITSRLDYIKDLGVETVWISPIYKSPMKDFGYDVSDYRAIDPTFGTMADFDELVTEIKSRGMKLMLDYVPNHSSNEHDWFNKSIAREGQYSDYYIWRDGTGPNGTGPPNNWISVFGGSAWEFVPQRNQSYLHQFLIEQPDLNFRNPKVHEEVLDNMRFWLDKGVDGFRIDAPIFSYENINLPDEPRSWDNTSTPFDYSYLNHVYTTCQPETLELVSEWRDLMNSYKSKDNKHRALILENSCSSSYYGNATHPLADFPFNWDIMTIDSNTKATEIVSRIQHYLENLPDFAWANFLVGNHDNRRVAGRMGEQNVDGINMMVLLIGGTAVIYNGDEIGMTNNMNISYNDSVDPQGCNYGPENYLKYSRDPERTPCQWNSNPGAGFTGDSVKPWLPINSNHVTINREFEENDPKSHLNVFKKLGRLRVEDSIQRGSIEFPYTSDNVLTFSRVKRGDGGRGFVVTINVSPNEETIDVTKDCCHDYRFPGNGTVRVASGTSGRAEGETVQLDRINLKANEALVIEFSPVL